MTAIDAIAEARRRWGDGAGICNVWCSDSRCAVGRLIDGIFTLIGQGASWEQAFEDADHVHTRPKVVGIGPGR